MSGLAIAALVVSTAVTTSTVPARARPIDTQLRRTITSTAFSTTVRPVPSPVVEAPVEAPRPPPAPPPRIGTVLAGMHTEYAVFMSPFLADRMAAISAQQPMQGELSELVLLLGIGVTGEVRFLDDVLAVVPAVTYLFTPRFFSVSVETDGTVEAHLSFAQAIAGAVRMHGYVPLSGWTDLVLGAGPSLVHARFRGRGETAVGLEGRFGFQFHFVDLPDARLLGVVRYAPIDFGDGVELDLSGAGLVADLVFGVM